MNRLMAVALAAVLVVAVAGCGSRDRARKTRSAANLRTIGLVLHVYAVENEGRFPDSLEVLVDSGTLTADVLKSPAGSGGYIYVKVLTTTAPEDQQNKVLAYEDPANYKGEIA